MSTQRFGTGTVMPRGNAKSSSHLGWGLCTCEAWHLPATWKLLTRLGKEGRATPSSHSSLVRAWPQLDLRGQGSWMQRPGLGSVGNGGGQREEKTPGLPLPDSGCPILPILGQGTHDHLPPWPALLSGHFYHGDFLNSCPLMHPPHLPSS